ncbi:hypothetical protein CSB45_03215 [candidate division KSB3 bacterium]|uniref:Uncharacterized protein n=1 Tax=candidate division KSB3 bacterium TaxID=2044937 RepID=A0A2G6E9D5_9BACT|nr:MAG: hypothetical protein CSB45_03215 [candidate division KSB3 bacterium]
MKRCAILSFVIFSLIFAGCPASNYQKGLTLIEEGQIDPAIQELLTALEKDPLNGDIYYQLGLLYLQKEEYRRAMEFFQQVIDRFPAHPHIDGAYYHLGFCRFQFREYASAIKNFSWLLISFPDSQYREDAQFYRAESARYAEDFGKATGFYTELLHHFPAGKYRSRALFRLAESCFTLGNYDESSKNYRQFLDQTKRMKLDAQGQRFQEQALFHLAQSLIAQNEPGRAVEYLQDLQRAFPVSPKKAEYTYTLGKVYVQLGRDQAALDQFQMLAAASAESEFADDALFHQASLHYRRKEFGRSAQLYAQLIENFPESPNQFQAALMGANCLFRQQQYDQAAHAYERVLEYQAPALVLPQELGRPNEQPIAALKRSALLSAAVANYHAGNYQQAWTILNSIPETERTEEEVLWTAELAYRLNLFDSAKNAFQQLSRHSHESRLLQHAYLGMLKVLYGQEQWQAALQYLENIPPELLTPEAFLIAGDCALNLKDFARAIEFYQTIRKRNSRHPMARDVLYYVGTAAYKLEKFEEARRAFSELYRLYPGHRYAANAQYLLAWTYFREDDYTQAIQEFKDLMQRFPQSPLLPQARLKIADSYFNKGIYDLALKEYTQIVQQYQDQPEILGEAQYGMALVYKVTQRYEEYLATTREFIEKNPDSPLSITAQYQIAEQFYQQEEFDQAIHAYQWILDRSPDSEYADNALYRIAQSYLQQENLVLALSAFRNVVNLHPNSPFRPDAHYELANIHFTQLDFKTAAREYRQFVQDYPADSNVPQAMYRQGLSLLRIDRPEEAAKIFEQLIQRFPTNPQAEQAGFQLGDTLAKEKSCQDAEQAFSAVLNGNDGARAAQARLKLAECYERSSDFDTAVSEYLKIIYLYPRQTAEVDLATFASATIYEKQGKLDEARNLYKKIVESSTNADMIQQAKQQLQALP